MTARSERERVSAMCEYVSEHLDQFTQFEYDAVQFMAECIGCEERLGKVQLNLLSLLEERIAACR